MKKIVLEIDEAYGEVLTISAVGRSRDQLNVSTNDINIHDLKKGQEFRVRINSVGKCTTEKSGGDKRMRVTTCDTCLYDNEAVDAPPCSLCNRWGDNPPSQWEPKEGEG